MVVVRAVKEEQQDEADTMCYYTQAKTPPTRLRESLPYHPWTKDAYAQLGSRILDGLCRHVQALCTRCSTYTTYILVLCMDTYHTTSGDIR